MKENFSHLLVLRGLNLNFNLHSDILLQMVNISRISLTAFFFFSPIEMKTYDIMLFVKEYFCIFIRSIAPLAEPRQSGCSATNVVE